MVELEETVIVPAPLREVWPLLSDPAAVASCIPGAALTARRDDGSYEGHIVFKFGPTVATFRGQATLAYDDDAHRCTIDGRGIDQRGASRATASFVMAAGGAATTTLALQGTFNVSGPLEMFANAGGRQVAKLLMADFAAGLAEMVAQRRGTHPSSDRPATVASDAAATVAPLNLAAPRHMNAGLLAWRLFVQWLRGLFGIGASKGSES